MKHNALLVFLCIAACSDGQQRYRAGSDQTAATHKAPHEPAQRDSHFCGGETDLATVERYFSDLEKTLAHPGPQSRFNRFVRPRYAVTDTHGQTLYFNVADVGSPTPAHITIPEWREIHRRGRRALNDAGYRGCFMDHGKIWFEASEEHGFRLAGIARNMPWIPLGADHSSR
jgi:hypothetical protein